MTDEEKNGNTNQDPVQKAFEEGLEQGYWVGRMISEALGRKDNDEQPDKPAQEIPQFMQEIIDIAKDKGVELE